MADRCTPQERSQNMAAVRACNTQPELAVRRALHRMGYRFRLHRKDLPGTPDIVLPKMRTAIFVHGCYWHGHSCRRGSLPTSNREFWEAKINKNRERDGRVEQELKEIGWIPIVIWGCEVKRQEELEIIISDRLKRQI